LQRRGDEVKSGLASGCDRFVEFGHPLTVLFVGLILHLVADRVGIKAAPKPEMRVADEPEHRFLLARLHPDDHHPRNELVIDRE
jgi:hypothetical protein